MLSKKQSFVRTLLLNVQPCQKYRTTCIRKSENLTATFYFNKSGRGLVINFHRKKSGTQIVQVTLNFGRQKNGRCNGAAQLL